MRYREAAYQRLTGKGLEIGALDKPARLPASADVIYFDVQTRAQAAEAFKEIDAARLVEPHLIGDIDRGGLAQLPDESFDFVIASHVIEHLCNPLQAIRELFRILRRGGLAIIAIPDKDYTFDRLRGNVSWEHLWADFREGAIEVTDEHYVEFLRSAHQDRFAAMQTDLEVHVEQARARREHVHAWDSATFRAQLRRALEAFGIAAFPVEEASGEDTKWEYFGLWQKGPLTIPRALRNRLWVVGSSVSNTPWAVFHLRSDETYRLLAGARASGLATLDHSPDRGGPPSAGNYRYRVTTGAMATLELEQTPFQLAFVNPNRGSVAGSGAPFELYAPDDLNARLNVSFRATATADSPIVSGFVLSRRQWVLIRAIGPGLAQFGVADAAAEPRLALFRDSVLLAEAFSWGRDDQDAAGPAGMEAVFDLVGAFPLARGSQDCAELRLLDAGSYSVHATNAGGPGTILIELYYLPFSG